MDRCLTRRRLKSDVALQALAAEFILIREMLCKLRADYGLLGEDIGILYLYLWNFIVFIVLHNWSTMYANERFFSVSSITMSSPVE